LESHVPLGCVTSSVTPPPVGAVTSFAHSTSRLGPRGSHRGWSAPEATPMLSPEWPKRRVLMPDSYSLQMLDGAWGRRSRPNPPRASLSSGGPAPDLPLPPSSPLSPTAGPFPPPVGAAVAVPLTDGDGPALWSSTTDAQHAAGVERVKQCIRGPPSYSSNTSPPRRWRDCRPFRGAWGRGTNRSRSGSSEGARPRVLRFNAYPVSTASPRRSPAPRPSLVPDGHLYQLNYARRWFGSLPDDPAASVTSGAPSRCTPPLARGPGGCTARTT